VSKNLIETAAGAVVLIAAAAFLFHVSSFGSSGGGGSYPLQASFARADGLDSGSEVRVAGVRVGSVTSILVDPETYLATARLEINDSLRIPEDSSAEIRSAGLLGDAYVDIVPGAADRMLAAGGSFAYTQSSVGILDLVGQFIAGSGEN